MTSRTLTMLRLLGQLKQTQLQQPLRLVKGGFQLGIRLQHQIRRLTAEPGENRFAVPIVFRAA